LPGIVSVLAGAQEVVISDYPSPEILANIEINCTKNISPHSQGRVCVAGHEWGKVDDEFSKMNAHRFTRILTADCLWMEAEHQNLVTSMLHFLSQDDEHAQVWVVAGFHTGRAALASFFEVAHDSGLDVKRIWERDIQGNEREWVKEPQRRPEDITTKKKWLAVAILGRK
jgi:predicted nicotinamide N-methyase